MYQYLAKNTVDETWETFFLKVFCHDYVIFWNLVSDCGWHYTHQKIIMLIISSRSPELAVLDWSNSCNFVHPVTDLSLLYECIVYWTKSRVSPSLQCFPLTTHQSFSMHTYTSTVNSVVWTSRNIAPFQSFAWCSIEIQMKAHLASVL